MALLLLSAQEIGADSDLLVNTHWLLYATKKKLSPDSHNLTLVLNFAITIENPPSGSVPLDVVLDYALPGCPDPDAVLRRILQA